VLSPSLNRFLIAFFNVFPSIAFPNRMSFTHRYGAVQLGLVEHKKKRFPMKKETRLTLAICLSLLFMIFEITGGLWANSLAILSDAAHLLTDVAGFAIALVATMMATAPASKHYSFGLARAEVLGALLSILSLWVLTFWLIVEAYERTMIWYSGGTLDVDGKLMFVIACIGVLVNICLSCVFMVCSSSLLPLTLCAGRSRRSFS
jgi:Co/Zn/Cd efflux system component